MSRAWLEQPERGTLWALRLMTWFALFFGWRASRMLLYPITVYFYLSAPEARRASRHFLAKVLPRPTLRGDVFRHIFSFASVILDRVYFLSGRDRDYRIDFVGLDVFESAMAHGGGAILLGSHLGSFEVMRLLAIRREVKVRPLMYEANAARIRTVFGRLNPALAADVIALGEPASMLRVKECLARGECIGMLGDRIARGDKSVSIDFLGDRAALPAGPFILASALAAPVVLFYGLYRGPRHYEARFARLADHPLPPADEPAPRARQIQYLAQDYADQLAFHARLAPYNWFNFYDFWGSRDDGAQ